MCCWTHGNERFPGELAASENWRCRCGAGGQVVNPDFPEEGKVFGFPNCTRKATAEDLLCDICSGRTMAGPDPDRQIKPEELYVQQRWPYTSPPNQQEIDSMLREMQRRLRSNPGGGAR